MLFGKTQFRGEVLPNEISIKQRDGAAAHFEEFHAQDVGDRRFS